MGPYGPGSGPGFNRVDRFIDGGYTVWGVTLQLLPLILFTVAIGVVIWAVLRLSERPAQAMGVALGSPRPTTDPALEELRLRYARGDMSREEFMDRGKDLGAHPGSIAPAAKADDAGS